MMPNYINYIQLLRPAQWAKNLFVFLAMFFGGKMLDHNCWSPVLYAFAIFCMASSSVYCFNDVVDSKSDAADISRCKRPVAAGKISKKIAIALSVLLGLLSVIAASFLGQLACLIVTIYLALNILYSLGLKKVALLDIAIIAFGFELRLIMGSLACDVKLSSWIIIMVFLLTLFLAMAKRRSDLLNNPENQRNSVKGYTKEYVNLVLTLLATIMIVAYIIYTLQPNTIEQFGTDKLYITSIFVLGGMLRYLQIAVVNQNSGNPTNIFYRDKIIIFNVLCWILSFGFTIYL